MADLGILLRRRPQEPPQGRQAAADPGGQTLRRGSALGAPVPPPQRPPVSLVSLRAFFRGRPSAPEVAPSAAHPRYCDLKPSNVLIDDHGVLKLAGFGLARRIPTPGNRCRAPKNRGTPYYMAPDGATRGCFLRWDWNSKAHACHRIHLDVETLKRDDRSPRFLLVRSSRRAGESEGHLFSSLLFSLSRARESSGGLLAR